MNYRKFIKTLSLENNVKKLKEMLKPFGDIEKYKSNQELYSILKKKYNLIHNPKDKRVWFSNHVREYFDMSLYDYKRLTLSGCQKCGSKSNIYLHHIIPLSKKGDNSIKNLIPLCKECHELEHGFIIKSFKFNKK